MEISLGNRGKFLAAAIIAALVAGWQPAVVAVEMPTLFTAEVPLDEDARDPREAAYRAALVEVLARVSGSDLSGNDAAIDELFPVPSAYVTQFRPGPDETLFVSFDGEAVERVLRNSGFTVWGSDRPLTLIWLAVDWGRGERSIVGAENPDANERATRSSERNRLLRERILEIAERRGVPVSFPVLDETDRQNVTFSDIRGGFDSRIVDASKRYDVNSVLTGFLQPAAGQGNRWNYSFSGNTRSWGGSPETVIAQIADLLAAEFSVGGNEPLQRVALRVSGIESIDAYGAVQTALANIAVIEAFSISEVVGDSINYRVEVRGGASRLRRALSFAGLIEQESFQAPGVSAPDLEFFYNP